MRAGSKVISNLTLFPIAFVLLFQSLQSLLYLSYVVAGLTNDEKRAHLIDLRREHLIDQVCVQEILPPKK